jgi:hypothetical protein
MVAAGYECGGKVAGENATHYLIRKAGATKGGLEEAFGLWKDRDESGTSYQDRLRSEWHQ